MSKRPSRLLSWAYDAIAGAVVEPPGGLSAAGWAKDTRPPAPYMNFLLNTAAGWINFLRGPNLANWSRQSPITEFSDTTHIPLKMAAVDTETVDGATAAWRYVVVGNGTGGDAVRQLWCSRRGDAWVMRTNLPIGADGTMVGVHYNANRALWFCWTTGGSGDGQIFYTPAGDSGAVGDDGVDWTASALPGGVPDIVGVAGCSGSRLAAITINSLLTSIDGGANFTAATLVGSFTGAGLDLAWSGSYFVALTDAEVFRSTSNTSATWARLTLTETSSHQRLATDGAGTVVVYRTDESTVQNLLVSTDDGATWSTVPGFTGMKHLKRLVYGDGVWIATSSDSPYIWQSNDLVKWVRLAPPVLESGSLVPLDVVYADGRWLAVGNGFTLLTSRAADPMPGTFVPNGDPPVLADAGYLRGRKIATTAPADTQALAWSETNAQWEPTTIGGGSITSSDITDSTSVGRSVLTATDAAAARAAIGVSGGGTHGSGTLAARPASPAAGDTYAVTSGAQSGARFICYVAGSWEGSMSFSAGHSWERASAASAGAGARFLDTDTGVITVSSGDDAVGWYVELGGLNLRDTCVLESTNGHVRTTADLTAFARDATTLAVLFRWDGDTSHPYYFFGSLGTRPRGLIPAINSSGANWRLVIYQGDDGVLTTMATFAKASFATGWHALTIAPVLHDFGAGAVDALAWSLDGSAVAYVATAIAYTTPGATDFLVAANDDIVDMPLNGAVAELAAWTSTLTGAQMAALSTVPATPTCKLPITSAMGVPKVWIQASRYDPRQPTVCPVRVDHLTVVATASSVTRREY